MNPGLQCASNDDCSGVRCMIPSVSQTSQPLDVTRMDNCLGSGLVGVQFAGISRHFQEGGAAAMGSWPVSNVSYKFSDSDMFAIRTQTPSSDLAQVNNEEFYRRMTDDDFDASSATLAQGGQVLSEGKDTLFEKGNERGSGDGANIPMLPSHEMLGYDASLDNSSAGATDEAQSESRATAGVWSDDDLGSFAGDLRRFVEWLADQGRIAQLFGRHASQKYGVRELQLIADALQRTVHAYIDDVDCARLQIVVPSEGVAHIADPLLIALSSSGRAFPAFADSTVQRGMPAKKIRIQRQDAAQAEAVRRSEAADMELSDAICRTFVRGQQQLYRDTGHTPDMALIDGSGSIVGDEEFQQIQAAIEMSLREQRSELSGGDGGPSRLDEWGGAGTEDSEDEALRQALEQSRLEYERSVWQPGGGERAGADETGRFKGKGKQPQ
nr:hypothetical protein HK105_001228 [Polyrhizophydium stewartii]